MLMPTRPVKWRRELILGAVLLAVGVLLLPPAVYIVGQRVFGEYAENAGIVDLELAIWRDLGALSLPAWILVLSPYLVIMLLRLAHSRWKPPRSEALQD
jgi:hypothetical protein